MYNLKTELALTQSWFSSVKCTKRGVLLYNTAFEVRFDSFMNLVFHRKLQKKLPVNTDKLPMIIQEKVPVTYARETILVYGCQKVPVKRRECS